MLDGLVLPQEERELSHHCTSGCGYQVEFHCICCIVSQEGWLNSYIPRGCLPSRQLTSLRRKRSVVYRCGEKEVAGRTILDSSQGFCDRNYEQSCVAYLSNLHSPTHQLIQPGGHGHIQASPFPIGVPHGLTSGTVFTRWCRFETEGGKHSHLRAVKTCFDDR